jgi:hypothetical protein
MADDDETPPHGGGHGLGRKIGPLPMWGWAVGLGAVVGLVFFLRKGKSTTDATSAADSAAAGSGDTTPTSLIPINQGLSQDQADAILAAIKKLHGPPSEDDDDDDDDPPSKTTLPGKLPWPPPVVVKPRPKPRQPPKTVTVVKWTRDHTPWNSTLWGIANHEHVKGGWQYLQKLNHISGDPKKALKPGMKVRLG